MSAGWVAGSVRAKAMARRRLGPDAARQLASSASLGDALRALAATPYGHGNPPERSLEGAQHAIAGKVLWDLRVLAGWLPRDGVQLLRALAGWFELANIEELLQAMAGRPAGAQFALGALATAWPRLSQATSVAGLRTALVTSAWRDPGGDTAQAIRLGLRVQWAARAANCGEPARTWAAGAAAALLAGERFTAGRPLGPAVLPGLTTLLGPAAAGAATLEELIGRLPARARWALAGITSPADLWRAGPSWWARVEQDGSRLLGSSAPGAGIVLGAVAVLSADARRASAALETAARGGEGLEAYDALA